MSKQCEIIQDLLPLYVDDACSQSSTEMIKEHLKTCQPCSEIYQQMNSHTNEIILKKEKDGVIARHSRKIKNKRALAIVFSVISTLVITFICINMWPASVYYGTSEMYSQQDMEDAIYIIKQKFDTWDGCKLYSISYTNDTLCKSELDYCNSLAPKGVVYTECIVFRSYFRSPIFGGDAWNPNFKYDWSWYLARTEGGNWELLTWGAP